MGRLAAAAEAASGGPSSNGAGAAALLVLLCGDFNTTPSAAACRVCWHTFELTGKPVWLVSAGLSSIQCAVMLCHSLPWALACRGLLEIRRDKWQGSLVLLGLRLPTAVTSVVKTLQPVGYPYCILGDNSCLTFLSN